MKFWLAVLAFLLTVTPARADEFNKEEIHSIIREYLVNNPAVMMEALEALQVYQAEEELRANATLIKTHQDALFHNEGMPSVGPKDAKVTLVEFYDYNCGACKIMFNALDEFLKEQNQLRVVFMEFPIFGEHSDYAARLALGVHAVAPERYFDFHRALMTYQGRVTKEVADSVLDSLKLDAAAVRKAAQSDAIKRKLATVHDLAGALNTRGTPLLVLNDEIIPHALDLETLRSKVEAASPRS